MNICVFCGSSTGHNSVFADAAITLGIALANRNITLVYGGGNVGLMGILADSVLKHGGNAVGVIPDFLMKREVGHKNLTRLEVVSSMHERKKRMADISDAFIAMPGGWGTLDELAEILTWKQLGLINQPVGILNTNHFFDPLLQQMNAMQETGFLRQAYLDFLVVNTSPEELVISLIPQ
ncbi:MAG TPA: TIGR00730 family Rossman fold protein [Chryseolinea sp.]|nr:TIGR00730 family Rossman fold protein [Chryseolinea sp.]HPH45574.1 TIGR00730 family Rossman fold protein [Chryseolinea sp.]HPM28994.1 TIGR00730 family Rossman fold protein [Chryseolinea sp.]